MPSGTRCCAASAAWCTSPIRRLAATAELHESAGGCNLRCEGRHPMDSSEGAPTQAASDTYRELIEIGIALSAERDPARLRERILLEAKKITRADAGTLYLKNKGRELAF